MSLLIEATRLFEASRFLEAEEPLHAVLQAQPGNVQARVLLGVIYAKTRRLRIATDAFEDVLKEVPDQFDSIYWLATIKRATGAWQEALELCERG